MSEGVRERRATRVGVDVDPLERDLREAVDGEVRFDDGHPRGLLDRRVELPAGAARRRRPPDARRRGRRRPGGRPAPRAGPLPRRRHQPGRRVHEHGGGDRLVEVLPRDRARRPRGAQRVVQPGVVLDVLNAPPRSRTACASGPEPSTHPNCTLGGMLGNNSCGATAQRYGKTVDNMRRLEVITYGRRAVLDRPLRRRPLPRSELGRRDGGRRPPRGDLPGAQATSSTSTPTASASATPTSRAGSRATTSTRCCPSTASTWPRRWSAARARCVTDPARRAGARAGARRRRRWCCSASATSPTSADAVPSILPYDPFRLEGVDKQLVDLERHEGDARGGASTTCRRAAPGCSSSWTADSQDERATQGASASSTSSATGTDVSTKVVEGRLGGGRAVEGPRGRARGDRAPGGAAETEPDAGRAGRTPPSTRERLGDYLRDYEALLRATATRTSRCTGTSARAACTAASPST